MVQQNCQEETTNAENPPGEWEQPVRSEDLSGELQSVPEGFEPTDTKEDAEAGKDFWSIQVDFIDRHHIDPRVQLCAPKEETFTISLKYIDVTGVSCSHLDVLQEKRVDHWNVDANRSLSDSWKGITKFTLLKEKSPKVYMWSGWRLTKKSSNYQTWVFVAWSLVQKMGKAAQKKEKQEWANEKPQLDNARRLGGICFIDPEDDENKETIKDARRKLEVPMQAAVPCKKGTKKHSEASRNWSDDSNKILKNKTCMHRGGSWVHENRLESSLPKDHEDHVAGKRYNSLTHCKLVHKLIPMPQAMKVPDAKEAGGKKWKKLEAIPAWQLYKINSKKQVILETQRDKQKVHFATLMDIYHLKNAELEAKKSKVQRKSRAPKWHCKTRLWSLHSLHWTRLVCVPNHCRNKIDVIARLPDCDGQAADAVSAYTQVKMEDAPKLLRIPKSECPKIYGYVFPDTSGPNRGQTQKIQWFLLNEILYGHPLAGPVWERQFEKVVNGTWMGKSAELGMSFLFIENKDCSNRCTWIISKITGKKQNMAPMWKKLMKIVDLDEPTSFLDHVYLGCTQRECKPNEIIIEEYRKMLESRISAGATENLPGWVKPHAKTVAWSYEMEGHARKCIERYFELTNKKTAVRQSLLSLLGWSAFQERGTWICWRTVKNMLTNCPEMLVHGNGRSDMLTFSKKLAWSDRRVARWSHTFTTQVTTDNIVMCETRLSIVDWVFSKTRILLVTLRTQNQPRWESYVFSEVEHSSPLVGCTRNKHQYLNVVQNQKLFRWMMV